MEKLQINFLDTFIDTRKVSQYYYRKRILLQKPIVHLMDAAENILIENETEFIKVLNTFLSSYEQF